jgi:hypothetical protein
MESLTLTKDITGSQSKGLPLRGAIYACDLAMKGFPIREEMAHGPIKYQAVFLGTPESIADKLQQWFEAGTGKGFAILGDCGLGSLTDFVEQGVPILQKRGLFRTEYSGSTFRLHLALPYQNGFAAFENKSQVLTY